MKIPFYDFKRIPKTLLSDFCKSITNITEKESLIDGASCRRFEEEFAELTGVKYAIGVANGLDALTISLLSLGIQPGNRVAVPTHTFIATWFAVTNIGAVPVPIDVNDNGQMNQGILSNTPDLDAVIIVHMHGFSGDVGAIRDFCNQQRIPLIEDCAQAHGLTISGKFAGSWGDISAFSFYPTKNLGVLGDGGAIVTNNQELAQKAMSLSRYGQKNQINKYEHFTTGYNSRLDTIHAAWLLLTMNFLDEWNQRRVNLAERYINNLQGYTKMMFEDRLDGVYHHFTVLEDARDQLRSYLFNKGIATEIHYPVCPAQEFAVPQSDYINAFRLSRRTLSLPMNQWLSENEIDFISEAIISFLNSRNKNGL